MPLRAALRPRGDEAEARPAARARESLLGGWDQRIRRAGKERFAAAVARFTSDPKRELRELVLRDVLDVALGNTDHRARNTAVLKQLDGRIELSPLYDFAPMVLDPQGIACVSR